MLDQSALEPGAAPSFGHCAGAGIGRPTGDPDPRLRCPSGMMFEGDAKKTIHTAVIHAPLAIV
jgi:hypothetical protein